MKLDTYTFAWTPDNWDPPIPRKRQASVLTMEGVGYFSWGTEIIGKEIDLEWNFVSLTQYDALEALYVADESVLWDLDVAGMQNYMVELVDLAGELPEVAGYDQGYMHKVRLTLLILSQTGAGTS